MTSTKNFIYIHLGSGSVLKFFYATTSNVHDVVVMICHYMFIMTFMNMAACRGNMKMNTYALFVMVAITKHTRSKQLNKYE